MSFHFDDKFFLMGYKKINKILQLINNPDCNVYNGDIGYITKIETRFTPRKKEYVVIDFDGNYVEYTKEDLKMIKHAYAITIHKSQGSEGEILFFSIFVF